MTTAQRDGVLALVALIGALGAAIVTETMLSPIWLFCGALGTVVLEVIATRYREPVRALWERRTVQAGSLAAVLLLATFAAIYTSTSIVSLLVGGLAAYLCVLVFVSLELSGRA